MNGIRAPPTDSHNRYSQCLTKVYISMNKINIPSPPCLLWYNSQSPQSFNNITYNNTTITVHSSSSTTPHGYYNYISSSASHLRVLNHRRSTTWLAEDNKVIKCMWILPPLLPLKWFHFVNESTDAIHSVNVNLCRHHPFNLPGDQQKQLVARTDKFSSLHSPRTPGLACLSFVRINTTQLLRFPFIAYISAQSIVYPPAVPQPQTRGRVTAAPPINYNFGDINPAYCDSHHSLSAPIIR